MVKFLIIGCGLTGSVIGRELAEAGHNITIWDRRNHIGGNMFDYKDLHGINVHKYGPHCFHTNNKKLYDYICRYGQWQEYRILCKAVIDGIDTPSPFNFQTIDDFYGKEEAEKLKAAFCIEYPDREFVTVVEALESNSKIIRDYAQFLFEKDYSLYTAKQWGISPSEIDPSVLKRVPLRLSYKDGYFDDEYQVMPVTTYEDFFKNILNHPNIDVHLGMDALPHLIKDDTNHKILVDGSSEYEVVFTGALDELFDCRFGKLPYRSLRFEWKYEDIDSFQDAALVAYPQEDGYTRIVEYKKMPKQEIHGTSYAIEYPIPYVKGENIDPYYPVLTDESMELYDAYKKLASIYTNLITCGRLADFKYYNMDQCLERCLDLVKDLKDFSKYNPQRISI